MSIEVESPRSTGPELIWVGDGAWVAHDPSLPEGDPRRVIAYMEHKDRRVYVLWVRDRQDVSPKISGDELEKLARASAGVIRTIEGREIVNVIVRAPRLVNIATKPL